jgi:hypothetical protein
MPDPYNGKASGQYIKALMHGEIKLQRMFTPEAE